MLTPQHGRLVGVWIGMGISNHTSSSLIGSISKSMQSEFRDKTKHFWKKLQEGTEATKKIISRRISSLSGTGNAKERNLERHGNDNKQEMPNFDMGSTEIWNYPPISKLSTAIWG